MLALLTFLSMTAAAASPSRAQLSKRQLDRTISTVERMVQDSETQRLARRHGLSLVNVTWEDTGRSKGSSWGPNISDMTIGVRDSRGKLHPMPVFRFDNFHDKTTDLQAENIWVRTGNEDGKTLEPTRLVDVLSDVKDYLSRPRGFDAADDDLTAERDSHFLVSAQACFLPISSTGKSTFTPVIYNYQSRSGAPAVMTLVATREGTSIQVVENSSGYMSETLFFNADGERAPYTATRLSTFKSTGGDATTSAADATEDAGLDVVLIIQVPLKQRRVSRQYEGFGGLGMMDAAPPVAESAPMQRSTKSNVETAVIGHGESEGRFKEINGLTIARDTRFPVRITAQFYKATSNGVVSAADVAALRDQIDRVYADGDYVGSLVTDPGRRRPTDWTNSRTAERHASPWARPVWEWHKAQ